MKNNILIVMLLVCYSPGLLAQEIEKKTKQKQVPVSPADSLYLWKDGSLFNPERIYNPAGQDAPYEKSYRQPAAGLMKQKKSENPGLLSVCYSCLFNYLWSFEFCFTPL